MGKGWKDAPKATLTIRLLIGAYLLYIDYQIYGDVMSREGTSRIVMLGIMVLFAVVGVLLIVLSVRALTGAGKEDTSDKDAGSDDSESL